MAPKCGSPVSSPGTISFAGSEGDHPNLHQSCDEVEERDLQNAVPTNINITIAINSITLTIDLATNGTHRVMHPMTNPWSAELVGATQAVEIMTREIKGHQMVDTNTKDAIMLIIPIIVVTFANDDAKTMVEALTSKILGGKYSGKGNMAKL